MDRVNSEGSRAPDNKKARHLGLDALRILAMAMIITLHYLDKGGVLPKLPIALGELGPDGGAALFGSDLFGTGLSGSGLIAWLIEAFCVPAVNAYVLISAYFLIDSDYKPGRAVKLWGRVIFYSALIPVLYIAITGVPIDKYSWLRYLMPVTQEHYWFITAYVIMVLIAPLMNNKLTELSEKSYRLGLALLLLVLSLACTLLPVRLPLDKRGYDALWFICLYMVGGYIKLHIADKAKGRPVRFAFFYVITCLLMFASLLGINALYLRTGALGDFITRQYQYNSLLNLAASCFLFMAFLRLETAGESRLGKAVSDGSGDNSKSRTGGRGPLNARAVISRLGAASLGVYLLHEHELIRYAWPKLFGVGAFFGKWYFPAHWLLSVALIYLAGFLIEVLRKKLYEKCFSSSRSSGR